MTARKNARKPNTPKSCSILEAARWIGVARQTLAEWCSDLGVGYDEGLDVPAFLKIKFRAEREAGREEMRKKFAHVEETIAQAEASGQLSADEAKRRKLVADMAIREMERDERAGLLVPIASVAGAVQAEYAIVREDLLALPGQLATELEGLDYDERKQRIADKVNKALSELQADARYRKEQAAARSDEE